MRDEASGATEEEIAVLIARLRAEVRASGGPSTSSDGDVSAAPLATRQQAEELWAVTADRPFLSKPGRWGQLRGSLLAPVKLVLKKLMRWYVEPALMDQRTFNAAVLRLVDELQQQAASNTRTPRRAAGPAGRGRQGRQRRAVRIAVCQPQVPFERGGTEVLTDALVEQLRRRGHEADLLTVPFKWYPGARVLSQALLWRLLDVEEANGRPIDLVIATKFPSYAVRHPNKVVWLFHQFRQAYDLHGTELGQFGDDPASVATRRAIERLDRTTLGEARRLFSISGNVAERLQRSTGLQAEVLHPPPPSLDFRCDEYGDFILSVGRLDRAKRVDLLLEAAATGDGLQVVVAGDGPDRARLEALARELGLDGRVTFRGPRWRRRPHRSVRSLPGRVLRARGRGLRSRSLRGALVGEACRDNT